MKTSIRQQAYALTGSDARRAQKQDLRQNAVQVPGNSAGLIEMPANY